MSLNKVLVIIPCGKSKIWDKNPNLGGVPAKHAYVGTPFTLNCQFAKKFSDRWIILSAEYGFIYPDFIIPGPYNTTFKNKSTFPIKIESLQKQVEYQNLFIFKKVIGLGGKEYRQIISQVFSYKNIEIEFPFAGLPIGKSMQAIKKTIVAENFHNLKLF